MKCCVLSREHQISQNVPQLQACVSHSICLAFKYCGKILANLVRAVQSQILAHEKTHSVNHHHYLEKLLNESLY